MAEKTVPVLLDTDKFEFMPYRRGKGKVSIEYIVPHMEPEPSGSVIYSGTFSTKMMAGEMSHIITMSADRALLKTKIPQDFVILWGWNHPEVLVKYAGQIVRQSKQLITFLNTLSAQGKRAAMIVSIQGGEEITFELGDAVETFVEIPTLVPIDNGLQYARLIGSSKYLNPLANVMPSSIASSVGFIDEKYSLVALEEDALPKDVVAQYEKQGVPLLESNEIFMATDETADMPVVDWLEKNPPQSFLKSLAYDFIFFRPFGEKVKGAKAILFNEIAWDKEDVPVVQNTAGRIAMPAVKPIYAEAPNLTYDYGDLTNTKSKPVIPANNALQFIQKPGKIEIDLSSLIRRDMNGFSIVICDLKGRIVRVIKLSALSLNKILTFSTKTTRLPAGAYIVNLQNKSMTITRRCVLMN